jgi:peptide/nickel transport system permease protein
MTSPKTAWEVNQILSARLFQNETFGYVIKRLLQALLTIFLALLLSFIIMKLSPGDYIDTLRQNPKISPERIQELIKQFGLDKPAYQQFGLWLWRMITHGDFGTSFVYQRPVAYLLLERVPATLLLAITSLIATWAIAIPLGIVAAIHQNRAIDKTLQIISYTGQGFPSFITALFLLFFAQITTPLFPVGDMTSIDHAQFTWLGQILDIIWHMILPITALSIASFAGLQRITRGELLDVLRQDYIQTARAKGLSENRVIYVHALRNAINPLITLLGFELGGLLSGAFITENFFNWPGLGKLTLQAVIAKDQYLVMSSLVVSLVMLIIGNLIADLLLKFADPRIQLNNPK